MKKTNKVILIGAIKEGQQPTCGETVKNQQFINQQNIDLINQQTMQTTQMQVQLNNNFGFGF